MNALERFVGIPYRDHGRDFDGVDCWGLVDLFHARALNCRLPDYSGLYRSAGDKAHAALCFALGAQAWERRTDPPCYGDVLLFRFGPFACHSALALGDGRFLHCLVGRHSCIESESSLIWAKRREGIYRWRR